MGWGGVLSTGWVSKWLGFIETSQDLDITLVIFTKLVIRVALRKLWSCPLWRALDWETPPLSYLLLQTDRRGVELCFVLLPSLQLTIKTSWCHGLEGKASAHLESGLLWLPCTTGYSDIVYCHLGHLHLSLNWIWNETYCWVYVWGYIQSLLTKEGRPALTMGNTIP